MLNETILEKRLAMLEQTVSDLQHKLESNPTSKNWLDKLIGSISDEAAFLEALEYGRISRQTDKPID
ncbi:MAG: transferase hexapeptide repeat containing protein [Acaryochloris sp. RU_4_1]|nr:transferase hexapeptide repeat containing protein [Acaryochloris sp. RU_4_1]NJR54879.1 transferase hexapeptide repeat containing protein [Acaryochloris sp. CRU_2_0]